MVTRELRRHFFDNKVTSVNPVDLERKNFKVCRSTVNLGL